MDNQEKSRKKFYKKWWFWVIIIIGIIIIASSSSDKPKKVGENNNEIKSGSTTVENKVFKVGDKVKMGDVIITVNKVEFSQGSQYSKPAQGNKWVDLNITIENTSAQQQNISTLGQMFIRDGDGNSYQVAATDKSLENPGIGGLDGPVIAKSKKTGWVGFEIKKDSKNLQFQYSGSMFGGDAILINLDR